MARHAGSLIQELALSGPKITHKGTIDIVTNADLAAEKYITEEIRRRFPGHQILAEEGGGETDADLLWVIDPIDGTTNYAHGFPFYAVSIAIMVAKESTVGVVYDPNLDEMFTAVRGEGTYLNEKPIRVSNVDVFDNALLATGFPYTLRDDPQIILADFSRIILACQGIRRAGAATLDLCSLACGRFDAFWERSLKPWDTAAAALIASEAGAKLTKFDSSVFDHFFPEMVASNGLLHARLLELLAERD